MNRFAQYITFFMYGLWYSTVIDAYPYFFYRLLRVDGDNIIKTVDFIGDYHAIIQHNVRKPSRGTPISLLPSNEKKRFTSAERSLLVSLRSLAHEKREKPIALLWEWNDEQSDEEKSFDHDLLPFIWYAGSLLRKEFAPIQHKNIVFVPADTYRFNRKFITAITYSDEDSSFLEPFKQRTVNNAFAFMRNPFEKDKSKRLADIDLCKVVAKEMREQLTASWDYYINFVLKNMYQKHIAPYELMQLKDFVLLPQFNEFHDNFFGKIVQKIMNYELLFKIFGSANHSVIYAGARHCLNVIDTLKKEYQFTQVVGCGVADLTHYDVTLLSDVWTFLKEPPFHRWQLYKKNGAVSYDHFLDENDINKFFSAVQRQSQQDMLNLLRKSNLAYVDLINAQDESSKTALYYAIKNEALSMAEFLLKHGAYPNIANDDGFTPLHKAVELENFGLAMLLLDNGANPLQKNNMGQSPLDDAQTDTMKKLLNGHVKKFKTESTR